MSYTSTLRDVVTGKGTAYRWQTMPTGLDVASRQSFVASARGGRYPAGPDVGEAGQIVHDVWLLGYNPATTESLRDVLAAAWAPDPDSNAIEELTVVLAGTERVYRGRPLSATFNLELIARGGIGAAQLVFSLTDPVWYASSSQSVTVTVADNTGGMVTPMDTPMVTTSSGNLGDASVFNSGTAPTPWVANLYGPLTVPRIILNGRTVQLDYTIAAGDMVQVDSTDQSATIGGGSLPVVSILSDFPDVPPGASTVSLRASAGTGSMTFTWRPASY